MADRETVIYDIGRCICHVPDACKDCSKYGGDNAIRCMEELLADALTLLKAQELGWISVKDRLPDQSGKYLIVAVEQGRIRHVTTAMFGTIFYMTGKMTHWRVTYWMPLPEPPKEG